jgi:hypothetical protein
MLERIKQELQANGDTAFLPMPCLFGKWRVTSKSRDAARIRGMLALLFAHEAAP